MTIVLTWERKSVSNTQTQREMRERMMAERERQRERDRETERQREGVCECFHLKEAKPDNIWQIVTPTLSVLICVDDDSSHINSSQTHQKEPTMRMIRLICQSFRFCFLQIETSQPNKRDRDRKKEKERLEWDRCQLFPLENEAIRSHLSISTNTFLQNVCLWLEKSKRSPFEHHPDFKH